MAEPYNHRAIEQKWRDKWEATPINVNDGKKPKYYCLDMFPYPSGSGLHVGHWRGYVISDVWSRYKMLQGYYLIHPMGWDAFGLPAENYAIKMGTHPKITTASNIKNIKRQINEIAAIYDWDMEVNTTDPNFYKWTQWIFVKMFKAGLAYEKEMPINWCPSCKTGLANEEVVDGCCERCGSPVTKKNLKQWMLRITKYADRLLNDLDKLDWPEKVKKMQTDWIGKSYGAEVILYGDVYDEACAHALELAEKEGYTFIHPFDDPAVATGQGTIAMEIVQELPLVDYILVPIGGGGLATGVSTLAKLLNPHIKVIGVEPAGAACMKASLKKGEVVTLPHVNTIADGTAVQTPGKKIFPYIQKNLDDIITIEDDELIVAFLDMVENHKMIVENSGLLTVAALRHLDVKNKKIVSILCGGNMDVITMSSVVQHGLIQRDRIFTVSVLIPDKPGELVRVASVIAKAQGNVIKLDHNQFVSTNRNAAVELKITLEAFGTDHKNEIVKALEDAGCRPKVIRPSL